MASPSGTAGRPHSDAGPISTITHDAHPSTPSQPSLGPSLMGPNSLRDLHSITHNQPLLYTVAEPERKNISQDVVRGFQMLRLDVPQCVAAKAAASYADTAPMARFLAETCGIDPKISEANNTVCVRCSSCRGTAGSWKSG